MKKIPAMCLFILLTLARLQAETYTARVLLEDPLPIVPSTWLVLIAVSEYQQQLNLVSPVEDARLLKEVLLSEYAIDHLVELYNREATKENIIGMFRKLQENTGPEDSVLIYYAGHGELDEPSDTAFWIPHDGGMSLKSQQNWLSDRQIRGYIKKIPARHVLLVVDSCFSGGLIKLDRSGGTPAIDNAYFQKAYHRISREILTSGALEKVPDQSEFTFQLIENLKRNRAPYLDPLMLFTEIRTGINQTIPLYGVLKDTGHQQGGSFLLFRKETYQAEAEKLAGSNETNPEFSLDSVIPSAPEKSFFLTLDYTFLTLKPDFQQYSHLLNLSLLWRHFSLGLELSQDRRLRSYSIPTLPGLDPADWTAYQADYSWGLSALYTREDIFSSTLDVYGGVVIKYPPGADFVLGINKTLFRYFTLGIENRLIINRREEETFQFNPYGNAEITSEMITGYYYRIGLSLGVKL